ncbi:MAG: glycosyltransferase family 9 protein, partial [Bacteroidota bacterium]
MPNSTHILVIRLSALGDVAMTVPVIRGLVQTYPNLRLTVVSRRGYQPLFEGIPNVDFLEADVYGKHKGLFGLMKLAKEARALHIHAVADLHNVIRSKILTRNLGFKGKRTATIDKGRAEKKKLTNAAGMGLEKLKTTHQRYVDVFASLGFPIALDRVTLPERRPLTPRLLTLIGREPKKCIGIAPFAAYESKMYPLDRTKELIQMLAEEGQHQILLFGGGPEEEALLKQWESQFERVTNVAGVLTFDEELNLISNLDLM